MGIKCWLTTERCRVTGERGKVKKKERRAFQYEHSCSFDRSNLSWLWKAALLPPLKDSLVKLLPAPLKGRCAAAGRGSLPAPVMHLSVGSGGGKGGGSKTACAHLFCTERNPDKAGGGSVWAGESGGSGYPRGCAESEAGSCTPREMLWVSAEDLTTPLHCPRRVKDCGAVLLSWTADLIFWGVRHGWAALGWGKQWAQWWVQGGSKPWCAICPDGFPRNYLEGTGEIFLRKKTHKNVPQSLSAEIFFSPRVCHREKCWFCTSR